MANWRTVKLGDVFSERTETNCIDLELLSVTGTRGIIPRSEIEGKDSSNEDKSKYLKVCKGDIAYNTMRMWQGVSALSDYEGIVSPAYTVLVPTADVDAKYCSYLFKLPEIIFLFYRHSQGLVDDTRNLKYTNFAKISAKIPPLPEQHAIAEILTAADRAIAVRERLIAAKQKQKRWLMQNLLTGKMRLPGFSGEWETVQLGKYLVEHAEKTAENNQYPVLTSSRRGLFLQSDYYNKEIASENNTGYNVVPYGYFTFRHMSDDEIFKFNINTIVPKGIVSTLYPVFTTKNINDKFLLELLNYGDEFRRFVRTQKQGGSRTYVYFSKLQDLRVTLPPLPEQIAIAEILTVADREIDLLNRELQQQRKVKKYLMQQLLTGRKRVSV
ncbi:MAG: restriction endonuclease subunit S [Christensenellaceae bacterium]|jgi:type I restriction enzyme S subunit|nr:restriction endonuclease subunit S [Christensenellaceae bacterium]